MTFPAALVRKFPLLNTNRRAQSPPVRAGFFIIFGLFVLLMGALPQATPSQTRTQVDSIAENIERIDRSTKNLRDFRAHVRQQKFFPDMGEEVTFLGTVAYGRPKQMLWEFTSPDASSLLLRPDGIWLIVPGMKQVQKMGSDRQKGILEKIDTYFLGFEKSLAALRSSGYGVEWRGTEVLEQGRADLVKLTHPGDPFASEIWIWFDTSRGVPLRICWKGAQNDTTTTDFFDLKINEGLDAHCFDLRVPAGYQTVIPEGT